MAGDSLFCAWKHSPYARPFKDAPPVLFHQLVGHRVVMPIELDVDRMCTAPSSISHRHRLLGSGRSAGCNPAVEGRLPGARQVCERSLIGVASSNTADGAVEFISEEELTVARAARYQRSPPARKTSALALFARPGAGRALRARAGTKPPRRRRRHRSRVWG